MLSIVRSLVSRQILSTLSLLATVTIWAEGELMSTKVGRNIMTVDLDHGKHYAVAKALISATCGNPKNAKRRCSVYYSLHASQLQIYLCRAFNDLISKIDSQICRCGNA